MYEGLEGTVLCATDAEGKINTDSGCLCEETCDLGEVFIASG